VVRNFTIIVAALAISLFPAVAQAKPAQCSISWFGASYQGPCEFESWEGGSFELSLPSDSYDNYEIPPYIVVDVFAVGRARVGWLTPTGRTQEPVEPVERDADERACWVGEEIRICAY